MPEVCSFIRKYSTAFFSSVLFFGFIYWLTRSSSQISSSQFSSSQIFLRASKMDDVQIVLVNTYDSVTKYRIQGDGKFLSYQETMRSLLNDQSSVAQRLSEVLTRSHDAVFWECAPVTKSEFNTKEFEFVIVPAPNLAARTVDIEPFSEKFQNVKDSTLDIISFENLGRDSTLVVPVPLKEIRHMTHLSSFLRYGNSEQVEHLWQNVGRVVHSTIMNERNSNKKFWLSTSGLGVSWLHIRIDTIPKYYNWKEYKDGR